MSQILCEGGRETLLLQDVLVPSTHQASSRGPGCAELLCQQSGRLARLLPLTHGCHVLPAEADHTDMD